MGYIWFVSHKYVGVTTAHKDSDFGIIHVPLLPISWSIHYILYCEVERSVPKRTGT